MNALDDQAYAVRQNLARVREEIAETCRRAGRRPDEVLLVGVTKYVEPHVARLLAEAGLLYLAESRPQELWAKAAALIDWPIRWHLVGHLQRNKVRRTLPLVELIHSADSLRLLEEIDREAASMGRDAAVLLEVNVSGDSAKHGFRPEEIEPLLPQMGALARVRVNGLMTMAALEADADRARREFAALRELRNRLAPLCPPAANLRELSMGMSGDYVQAVAEGATIVRIGSALFEGL
jgi:pyridoxal phosphate enzyme (YggS family)